MNIRQQSECNSIIRYASHIILPINKIDSYTFYPNIKRLSHNKISINNGSTRSRILHALVNIPNKGRQFISLRQGGRLGYLRNSRALSIRTIISRQEEAILDGYRLYYCGGLLKHTRHIEWMTRRG